MVEGSLETSLQAISRLQRKIDEVLTPLVPGKKCALLDFPHHPNVGDSAIWVGEQIFLSKLGLKPAYVCAAGNSNWNAMERAIGPDGTIVIHGGGNFGDVWPIHQQLREEVLDRFPDHPVLQFPQTVHFSDPKEADRTAAKIRKHGKFTLAVRDRKSLDFARERFECNVVLCPDMAFCIGPTRAAASSDPRILLLLRSDKEKKDHSPADAILQSPDLLCTDWLMESRRETRLRAGGRLFADMLRGRTGPTLRGSFYNALASERLRRGLRQLASFRYIVSDRLHVHILSTLLGRHHAVLDNNYGKLSSFIAAWNTNWDGMQVCHELPLAVEAARREILANPVTVPPSRNRGLIESR
ncbi:MAG TPA: polysaccharide pyruvyl transferase family protein [Steroidobacteraceae bacterium]|jgi:exopolysaccharide biosynthesis predicted pyruvyltransferase EpsI|nr:polysaccharide pyruvyl transferase family protein [Steroidobacteraceae bacterium]